MPPGPQPPSSYGGYGGELQSYGHAPSPVSPQHLPVPPPVVQAPQGRPEAPGSAYPYAPVPATPVLSAVGQTQRPAVVGMAATMAATASLQWVCALSFLWLVATAGARQLSTSGVDSGLYHALHRLNDRLLDGLAWPLYLFPVASFVLSFLLLARRGWARLAFTLLGTAALVWSGWWLRTNLVWWCPAAVYISVAVLVLWVPAVTTWLRQPTQSVSDPAGQLH